MKKTEVFVDEKVLAEMMTNLYNLKLDELIKARKALELVLPFVKQEEIEILLAELWDFRFAKKYPILPGQPPKIKVSQFR